MQVQRRIKQSEKSKSWLTSSKPKISGWGSHEALRQLVLQSDGRGGNEAHRHLSCSRVAGSVVYDLWCSMLLDADTVTLGCR